MEQNKNNSFGWILRFAAQCRGKLAASVLLAVLRRRAVSCSFEDHYPTVG